MMAVLQEALPLSSFAASKMVFKDLLEAPTPSFKLTTEFTAERKNLLHIPLSLCLAGSCA
jgi:hypothetical protein